MSSSYSSRAKSLSIKSTTRNRSRSRTNKSLSYSRKSDSTSRKHTCVTPELCSGMTSKGRVLASGGFGLIVAYRQFAIKLIRSGTTCKEAAVEYDTMKRVWDAFATAKQRTSNPKVRKALSLIRPVQPKYHWTQAFTIGNESFSCGIVTSLIKGAPTLTLTRDPSAVELFPRVMVLPSLGYPSGLSLRDADEPLSTSNPPRYFVLNIADAIRFYPPNVIDFSEEFPYRLGVLLATMTFLAELVLIDVELLLGAPTDPRLYVLDFGMCRPFKSTTPFEIGREIVNYQGPFYTKDIFPTPVDIPWYPIFERAFQETALSLGVNPTAVKEVVRGMRAEL